jgi:methionyl aminopeptidase
MRATVPLLRWAYVPSPARFGRYPVLMSSMAMTTYPDIRPVPDHIPRPPYVPANFFTAGWGDHLPGSDEKYPPVSRDVQDTGVRKAGAVVAELLREVGSMVKVSEFGHVMLHS